MSIYEIAPRPIPTLKKNLLLNFLRATTFIIAFMVSLQLLSGIATLKELEEIYVACIIVIAGGSVLLFDDYLYQKKRRVPATITIDQDSISSKNADDDIVSIPYTDVTSAKQSDMKKEIIIRGRKKSASIDIPYNMENYTEAVQLLKQHIEIKKVRGISDMLTRESVFFPTCIIPFFYGVLRTSNPASLTHVLLGAISIFIWGCIYTATNPFKKWTKRVNFILFFFYSSFLFYWFLKQAGLS